MRRLEVLCIAAAMCTCAAINMLASEVKVIANPSVKASSISPDDLKRVFLATKTSLDDGSRVEPVLEKSGRTHAAFLREYIGKTDVGLDTYYRSLVFTGKGSMPRTFSSDAEVVAYVARTKGSIGYVSADAIAPGVKTIEVK
jgi:ABC-type phosphate transport system substrate-binding protein